jgi:hypothetical protein
METRAAKMTTIPDSTYNGRLQVAVQATLLRDL